MGLTLILIRHAKSDWGDPLLADFDRPLNDRGVASAAAIGRWLAERGHVPGEVVLSGARRTVQTWDGIASGFSDPPQARTDRALYHAGPDTMRRVLRTGAEKVLMLIGHNPGIAEFAGRLVRTRPDHPRFSDFPTCATAVMTFPAPTWSEVGWATGQVVDFVVPRDLK